MMAESMMSNDIYVGNLPYDMTNEEIDELFVEFPDVIVDRVITKNIKKFCFLKCENEQTISDLIHYKNGQMVRGRKIIVRDNSRENNPRSYKSPTISPNETRDPRNAPQPRGRENYGRTSPNFQASKFSHPKNEANDDPRSSPHGNYSQPRGGRENYGRTSPSFQASKSPHLKNGANDDPRNAPHRSKSQLHGGRDNYDRTSPSFQASKPPHPKNEANDDPRNAAQGNQSQSRGGRENYGRTSLSFQASKHPHPKSEANDDPRNMPHGNQSQPYRGRDNYGRTSPSFHASKLPHPHDDPRNAPHGNHSHHRGRENYGRTSPNFQVSESPHLKYEASYLRNDEPHGNYSKSRYNSHGRENHENWSPNHESESSLLDDQEEIPVTYPENGSGDEESYGLLYVTNFPYGVTESELYNLFEDYYPIDVLVTQNLPDQGIVTEAYVLVESEKHALDAVMNLDNTIYRRRVLLVSEVNASEIQSELLSLESVFSNSSADVKQGRPQNTEENPQQSLSPKETHSDSHHGTNRGKKVTRFRLPEEDNWDV